jgi:hypothetical protein
MQPSFESGANSRQYAKKAALLDELQRLVRTELKRDRQETREDRRELREDRRETREDRRHR